MSDHTQIFFNEAVSRLEKANLNSSESLTFLQRLKDSFWTDLTGSVSGYFSLEDQSRIAEIAATRWVENFVSAPSPQEAWISVVKNFNSEAYWGFTRQDRKPKKENPIRTELMPYIWLFIQSVFFIKFAVYYFGLRSVEDPDSNNGLFLVIALGISFCFPIYFAWRQHKKRQGRGWD